MKKAISRCLLLLVLAFPLIAAAGPVPSRYLFVWAMEAKHPHATMPTPMPGSMSPNLAAWRQDQGLGKDFLAVFDDSADMMGAQVSHVAQVWRLSDLKLIKTIVLPPPPEWIDDSPADSSEPRVLADGKTVVVPTFNCGLFRVQHLASDNPVLQHVYDFGYRTCEVPVVAGDFLVETMQSGHAIVSLDLRDPEHPHEVSRLLLPPNEYPHWLALEPGGHRLVISGYGALSTHVRFA